MMDNLAHLLGLADVTLVTPDTPAEVSVVPRWDYAETAAQVGVSVRTIQRYWAELRDRGVLTAAYDDSGTLRFSDEDVAFFVRMKGAKSESAREGIAAAQRERIAQLTAASGSRRAAEAARAELRRLAEAGGLRSTATRVAVLLERFPGAQRLSPMHRVALYYATYYVTCDLVQLAGMGAPPVSTVERAFRRARA